VLTWTLIPIHLRPKIFLLATFLLAIFQLQTRALIRRCIFLTIQILIVLFKVPRTTSMYTSKSSRSLLVPTDSSISSRSLLVPADTPYTLDPQASIFAKRKYKPVARKIRPVIADLPDKFRITRNIVGDPLADMPQLSPNPPPFVPTGRYNAECRAIIDRVHPGDFLWPQERELMHTSCAFKPRICVERFTARSIP